MRRFVLCLALLAASAAQASIPTLYHPLVGNSDPVALVATYQPGPRSLNLVLNSGGVANTSGTVCDNGNGDNVCGLYVEIEVGGDLTIASPASFTLSPTLSAQVSANVVNNKKLRLALVTTASPITPGPIPLGTLQVASGPGGGAVHLHKLQTVDASLDLMNGGPRALAFIPEPASALQLAAGAAALALLARARRGGVR